MTEISANDLSLISHKLETSDASVGLEFHPFCIGWYNQQVTSKFCLQYSEDTLAFCIISQPGFFDNVFLKYISTTDCIVRDPFDQCLTSKLNELKLLFNENDIDVIHDFELHPTRRPKILVQTAGHVSGAAYYYQASDVENNSWGDRKINGVSVHPKYGGWFAFRGVLIFKNIKVPSLEQKAPVDKLSNDEKIQLLDGFNFHWKDWIFRDVSSPVQKYSELQKKYFETKPVDRFALIKGYI